MARFVELESSAAGTAVSFNPDHVAAVRPDPNDPGAITIVRLADGEEVGVRGHYADVVKKLAGG
jgi:hypothetical protein